MDQAHMPSVEHDSPFAASAFESKYRAWIITALYMLALACFRFDRRDIGFTVAGALAGLIPVSTTARFAYLTAALLVFLAAFLRTWTTAYSTAESARSRVPALPAANGPYRFVRHPVYLATILLFLGFGLLLNPLGLALLLVGMAALIYRLLLREEVERSAAHGQHYADYRAAVPSLLPAVYSHLPPGSALPDWRGALLREAYLWAFGLTLVTLAITLQERAFYVALAIALSVQAASFIGLKRYRKPYPLPASKRM